MSVFSLLKEQFLTGGFMFMIPMMIMWIALIILSIRIILNYKSKNRDIEKLKKQNSIILFMGSFMFLGSIFYQTLGFYQALSAIEVAGDISPSLIMSGLKVSFIAPLHGCFFFLLSGFIWFIFRLRIKKSE
ncbi:MAG: hypothetical protein SVU94_02550 [Bacteroidota bacterium]|nr:hypothetical protein [Bacteroidota bacterium]